MFTSICVGNISLSMIPIINLKLVIIGLYVKSHALYCTCSLKKNHLGSYIHYCINQTWWVESTQLHVHQIIKW